MFSKHFVSRGQCKVNTVLKLAPGIDADQTCSPLLGFSFTKCAKKNNLELGTTVLLLQRLP